MSQDCIFCRIVAGEIPSRKVYEDEEILAFQDIHPQAAVHILVIPKRHIASLAEVSAEDAALMGALMAAVPKIALAAGCSKGWRSIINTGEHGGQEVGHLHLHILGGQSMPAMLKY
jgi:histidine triad (HIT) family protein